MLDGDMRKNAIRVKAACSGNKLICYGARELSVIKANVRLSTPPADESQTDSSMFKIRSIL